MSEKPIGFIKIPRNFDQWGWYADSNTTRVFLELLLRANWEEKEYLGHKIVRGQAVFGTLEIAKKLGLSRKNIRTALTHLKSANEVAIKTTNRFSIVTIYNYEQYNGDKRENGQQRGQRSGQQVANKGPTGGHILEYKKNRIIEEDTTPPTDPSEIKKPYPHEDSLIRLSDKEVAKLEVRMEPLELEYWLTKVESWANSNPSKFAKHKSHYKTILNWRRINTLENKLNGVYK